MMMTDTIKHRLRDGINQLINQQEIINWQCCKIQAVISRIRQAVTRRDHYVNVTTESVIEMAIAYSAQEN